jgi:membrane associated rhomboid family serine protease
MSHRLRTLVSTWHGRLFLVNLVMFAYVTWRSHALFLPDTATLLAAGAKDPVGLASGEYWRLFTPVFVHVGLLHFGLNSYVLNIVGGQLETVFGGAWFIAIYLVAGVAGNIASALLSANLSAGASGAIFGLLGAGLYIEQSVRRRVRASTGRKTPRGAYLTTVVLNHGIGMLVPFVDNSAHFGGLVAGLVLAFAMTQIRPNNLTKPKPALGYAAIFLSVVLLGVGAWLGTSRTFVMSLLARAAANADEPRDRIFYLSQELELEPGAYEVGIERARLLFQIGEDKYALFDVREALDADPRALPLARSLSEDLSLGGKLHEATEVRRLIEAHEK